jgi:hypothetical protein
MDQGPRKADHDGDHQDPERARGREQHLPITDASPDFFLDVSHLALAIDLAKTIHPFL